MLHPALSRALAIAHIEDLHRDAVQRRTIRLPDRAEHEPHVAATSNVPLSSGWMWTGGLDGRSRGHHAPMPREMRSERS